MSKNKFAYNDFSKKMNAPIEEPVEEATLIEDELLVGEPVEEIPGQMTMPETEKGVPIALTGVVTSAKLNIRKEASSTSEIIGAIDKGAVVEINNAASTNDFYSVCTASGAEGFCMKKFIEVK